MEKSASAKQDTIRELKILREAYEKKETEKLGVYTLSNSDFYTDAEPICPEPPKKPPEPKSEPYKVEDYSWWKRHDCPFDLDVDRTEGWLWDHKKDRWKKWGLAIAGLAFIALGCTSYFLGIERKEWTVPILCGVGMVIGLIIAAVPWIIKFLVAIRRFVYYYKRYRPGQKVLENARLNEWDRYQKTVLPPYNQALAEYNEKKAEYDAAIEKREAEATKKREAESDRRMKAAQKAFDQTRAKLSVEISEKYYEDLADIIAILEDGRADTVKEAIAVLLDDKHKEAMLEEQRRLVYEQIEQNRELKRQGQEQAEFQMQMQQEQERFRQRQEEMQEEENRRRRMRQMEEDRRIEAEESARRDREQKAKAQCFSCGKNQRFPKCPMAGTIETVCPNFEPYHL